MMRRLELLVDREKPLIEDMIEQAKKEGKLPTLVELEKNMEVLPYVIPSNERGWIYRDGVYKKRQHTKLEDGREVEATLSVEPSPRGKLTHFDAEVLLGITEIFGEQLEFDSDGQVFFSIRELIRKIGLSESGKATERIKDSLEKWWTTSFYSEQVFWSEANRRTITDRFRFIDRISYDESQGAPGRHTKHMVELGSVVAQSIMARYVSRIDATFYRSLENSYARGLYRLLEALREEENEVTRKLESVHDDLSLSCKPYPSYIVRTLQRAHNELLESGYLRSVDYPQKDEICYRISTGYLERYRLLSSGLKTAEEAQIARRFASVKGVSRKEATKLVLEHGAEYCAYYLDALPYQEGIRNPAGWLKKALREGYELADYQLPPAYRTGGGQDTLFETREAEQQRRWEGYEDFFDSGEASTETPTSHSGEPSGSGRYISPSPTPDPDPQAAEVWEQVLESASETINSPSLNTWFKDAVPVDIKGDVLTLSVPNSFAREYIETRFLEDLQRSLSEVLGREGKVSVVEREEG